MNEPFPEITYRTHGPGETRNGVTGLRLDHEIGTDGVDYPEIMIVTHVGDLRTDVIGRDWAGRTIVADPLANLNQRTRHPST